MNFHIRQAPIYGSTENKLKKRYNGIFLALTENEHLFNENWNLYERFLLDMDFTINQQEIYNTSVFDTDGDKVTYYDRCEDDDSGEISVSISRMKEYLETKF